MNPTTEGINQCDHTFSSNTSMYDERRTRMPRDEMITTAINISHYTTHLKTTSLMAASALDLVRTMSHCMMNLNTDLNKARIEALKVHQKSGTTMETYLRVQDPEFSRKATRWQHHHRMSTSIVLQAQKAQTFMDRSPTISPFHAWKTISDDNFLSRNELQPIPLYSLINQQWHYVATGPLLQPPIPQRQQQPPYPGTPLTSTHTTTSSAMPPQYHQPYRQCTQPTYPMAHIPQVTRPQASYQQQPYLYSQQQIWNPATTQPVTHPTQPSSSYTSPPQHQAQEQEDQEELIIDIEDQDEQQPPILSPQKETTPTTQTPTASPTATPPRVPPMKIQRLPDSKHKIKTTLDRLPTTSMDQSETA